MSRPVPLFPSLPRSPNAPVLDQMVQFDADLTRALFLYLSDLARRVNDALTVDGQSPMEGNLNMGGFEINNASRLRLTSTTDAALASTLHALQIGATAAANLIMDTEEIMARNNGATATLGLQLDGGALSIGNTATVVTLNGGKLQFPATLQASANANTLDDYEEGTWTPVLTAATPGDLNIVYSVQVGTYRKVGDEVSLRWTIQTSTFTHTTAAGALRITGVPFTIVAGGGNFAGTADVGNAYTSAAGVNQLWSRVVGANIELIANNFAGAGRSVPVITEFASGSIAIWIGQMTHLT